MVKESHHWLRLVEKVYHYRRDIMSQSEREVLQSRVEGFEGALKGGDGDALKREIKSTEKVLRRCGGCYYPRSGWSENVEMFLIAAILAIGVRTYFIQPFKIPTNSMFPTYNGMTFKIYENEEESHSRPAAPIRLFRKLTFGAGFHETDDNPLNSYLGGGNPDRLHGVVRRL